MIANLFGRDFACESLDFKLFSMDFNGELNERRLFFMVTSFKSQEIASLLNFTLFSMWFKGDPNNFLLLVDCKLFAVWQLARHSLAGESKSFRSKDSMLGFMRDENERAADSMRLDCGVLPAE